MNITIFGATGNIGKRILREALERGHNVTAIVRNPLKIDIQNRNLKIIKGDILDINDVGTKVRGADVVISAYGPPKENPNELINATRSLINGLKKADVKRLIVCGGAGSLELASGVQLVDTEQFPPESKAVAYAHRNAMKLYFDEPNLLWSYASPAAVVEPGERTGKFRIGTYKLLTDEQGNSKISMEDYAVALVDEAENSRNIRKRFTIAY